MVKIAYEQARSRGRTKDLTTISELQSGQTSLGKKDEDNRNSLCIHSDFIITLRLTKRKKKSLLFTRIVNTKKCITEH